MSKARDGTGVGMFKHLVGATALAASLFLALPSAKANTYDVTFQSASYQLMIPTLTTDASNNLISEVGGQLIGAGPGTGTITEIVPVSESPPQTSIYLYDNLFTATAPYVDYYGDLFLLSSDYYLNLYTNNGITYLSLYGPDNGFYNPGDPVLTEVVTNNTMSEVTPLPATILLFVGGLALIGVSSFRRKRRFNALPAVAAV